MKRKLVVLGVLIAGLLALSPAVAKKHHPQKHPHGIFITSVDVVEKKLVMTIKSSGQALSYQTPLGMTITINEVPASLGQLHPGMLVVTYTEADEHVLSQLDVASPSAK